MFYFFKREEDTLTCEVRPSASGSGFDIIIQEPHGDVRTEHFPTSAAVHARWLELMEGFRAEGWWGPHIRDGRS